MIRLIVFLAAVGFYGGTVYWDYGNIGTNGRVSSANYGLYLNTWNYVTMISAGGSGSLKDIRVNAASLASSTAASGAPSVSRNTLYIGGYPAVPAYSTSYMDEVRVSTVARSNSWTTTEYNNQKNPSTFLSADPEQGAPTMGKQIVNIAAIPDSTGYKMASLGLRFQRLFPKLDAI